MTSASRHSGPDPQVSPSDSRQGEQIETGPGLLRRRLARCWPILAVLLVVSVLATLVSDRLTINALIDVGVTRGLDLNALLIGLQRVMILIALVLALLGQQVALRRLFVVSIWIVTLGLVTSVAALIATFSHQPVGGAFRLLIDGFLLWTMTILVFAAWYWLIDTRGGSGADHPPDAPRELLFPQQASSLAGWEVWHPGVVDYLFLAFNTNTSFSPSDTLFLSRRAKLLMMWQGMTALIIVAVILARAINMIQ
jgi:hypothetical protein